MRVQKQILLFITQIFCIICFAQHREIDSLNKLLPALHDTARVNCLNKLSEYYCNYKKGFRYYSRTDSAELSVSKAYSEAKKINYKLGEGNAFLNLSKIYLRRWDFYTAQHYTEQAISVFKNENAKAELYNGYSILVDVCLSECDNSSARKYSEMLVGYYKKIKDTTGESHAWKALIQLYTWLGNYDKAFECMQNQYNLLKNRTDPASVIDVFRGREELYQFIQWEDSVASYETKINAYEKKIGISHPTEGSEYFWEGKFDSAEYYNKKLRIFLVTNNGYDSITRERAILRSDIDLASIYQYEGMYNKALSMFMKALEFDRKKNVASEEEEELMNISMIYDLEGKYNDAIYYAQKVLSLARQTESSTDTRIAYRELWKIYDKKKDSANAYKYYLKYADLKDSTITQTFGRKLAAINEVNNEKEQQSQITALDKDNKIKQNVIQKNILIRNILLAGVAILILLSFIIYRIFSLKRKNEKLEKINLQRSLDIEHIENEKKQLELQNKVTQLETQALRAQMNPHFIFNCLNSINRFIINNNPSKAADYLTKFAKLIRIVLQQSGRSFIPLEDELYCLQLYMDLEALRFEIPFHYEINCNGINTSSVMIPSLLIQPFVENAIWHGLHENENVNGKININMSMQNSILNCKISDNGIGRARATGLKEAAENGKKSLGIKLTQHRLQLIDPLKQQEVGISIYDLTNESGENAGTCVDIKIPVKMI